LEESQKVGRGLSSFLKSSSCYSIFWFSIPSLSLFLLFSYVLVNSLK